jgi:putative tryptophan/tyrosine transport system substrate-binding protein
MRRRDFITLLAGAATTWPLAARAQHRRVPRIGVLVLGNPDPEPFLRVLQDGLRELGHIAGQNIVLELRSAGGNASLLSSLAADLVELNVDVIVAYQTPPVQAAKQATNTIPIVMAPASDPVGTGLVASLARPGGNITGLSATTAELAAKNLEFLREMLPTARRVAVLASAADPLTKSFVDLIQLAGQSASIELPVFMIDGAEKFAPAFLDMKRRQADAVIVQPSLVHKVIADLALDHRLPSLSPNRAFVEAGGLMAYVAKVADLHREAAVYVDRILKGRKPADLPVMQPNKFELLVNLKTAKALGLELPPALIARADEVME